MQLASNDKMKSLMDFLIVTICILCSGAVFYQNNHKIILISATLFVVVLYFWEKKKNLYNKSLLYFITFLLCYFLSCFTHFFRSNTSIVGEMGIVLQFVFILFACRIVTPTNFFKKYNKTLYFLCFSSIILYLIPFIFPNFPKLFPIIKDYAGSQFHNAGLFCYPTHLGRFYRNQSIFWESGAFQAFINLAIFLELFILKRNNKKFIFIYSIALLLTRSTTGYILFLLLLGTKIIQVIKNKQIFHIDKKYEKWIWIGFGIIFFVFILLFQSVIVEKFNPNSASYGSFVRRFSDIIIDIKILFQNFFNFLFGVGEEVYVKIFTKFLNETGIGFYLEAVSSNSITSFVAKYGILSAIPIFTFYIHTTLTIREWFLRILFAFLILFCLASENFIMAPIFLGIVIQMVDNNKKTTVIESGVVENG